MNNSRPRLRAFICRCDHFARVAIGHSVGLPPVVGPVECRRPQVAATGRPRGARWPRRATALADPGGGVRGLLLMGMGDESSRPVHRQVSAET